MRTADDIPALTALIDASVRGLQAGDYSAAQIDGALRAVYGVDTQLIADGTYFVVETAARIPASLAAAAGASGEHCTEETTIRRAKIRCSIRNATPRGFAPSSCIPIGRAAVSERRSWMRVNVRPLQRASHGSKWARR